MSTSSILRLGAVIIGFIAFFLLTSPISASLELLVSLRVILSMAFKFWLIDFNDIKLEFRFIFSFDLSSLGRSLVSSLANESPCSKRASTLLKFDDEVEVVIVL